MEEQPDDAGVPLHEGSSEVGGPYWRQRWGDTFAGLTQTIIENQQLKADNTRLRHHEEEPFTLRQYLIANLMDGDAECQFTMRGTALVDEVCELVAVWIAEQSGVRQRIETYYTGEQSDDPR